MSENVKKHLELFAAGFALVVVASINTWQLAHEKYLDSFVFGFFSALIWSVTVKKVVFAKTFDRIVYALGASIGGLVGLLIVRLIYGT